MAYLFDNYRGTRHVRRVATWIGFLLKAVEKLPGVSFTRQRSRQLMFDYRGRRFKVRYSHKVGARGGIQFVEVLPGRGAPEGAVALDVSSLAGAEDAYRELGKILDKFIAV
ncbi:MAG: hypothetical protein HY525_20285 [Betaproteobacteria bacterium]|nr:hypothetical protein [Betaproteobacteria bacterium]